MITFTVPAVPVAQPRQRVAVIAGHATTYTPTTHPVNAFKAACQRALVQAYHGPPLDGPLRLKACFVLPRRKNVPKREGTDRLTHAKRPDVDNLLKSLLDALKGLAWRDDSQLWAIGAWKCEAAADEAPHVEVVIEQ